MTTKARQGPPPRSGPLRSMAVGAIFGIDSAGMCLAMAAICFAGPLGAGQEMGTAAFALATVLSTLAIFLFGQFRLPVAISQDTSIAILAPAVGIVGLSVDGPVEAKVATVLALLGTTAFLSGLAFWLSGRLGFGRFLRMFPYPVSAGFLSSSGILLILAGISIITETMDVRGIYTMLGQDNMLRNLGIAMAFAAALTITLRTIGGALPLLFVMLGFLALFYLWIIATGTSSVQAVALGLLPHIALNPQGAIPPSLSLFGLIEWSKVFTVAPVIAAVVVMNLIGIILNTAGVEMSTKADIDVNHELRLSGLANMVIGGFGGITSYLQGGTTIILDKIGVAPVPTLIGHLSVIALAMGFAGVMVANVPTVFISGLLIFVGASMVQDWLIASLSRLPREDNVIILGIVLITITLGILPAIAIGLLLALISFAYGYAKMPLVRQTTNALHRPSILDRTPSEIEILERDAANVRILHLHGALFFGSVEGMIDQVRAIQSRGRGLAGLILDVEDVTRFDSSVPAALSKLSYMFGDLRVGLHLCGLPPGLSETFIRWGLPVSQGADAQPGSFQVWETLDQAIEHCEHRLLAEHTIYQPRKDITGLISELCDAHPRAADLAAHLERQDLETDEVLVQHTGTSQDVFFVEAGRLGAYLTGPEGDKLRVRSMGPGAVVGELAHVLGIPRSADVIAEAPSTVWCLSQATMARIDATDPELAAVKNLAMARALALKVIQTNALLTYARTR